MNSSIIAASRLRQTINPFVNANLAFSLRDLGLGATNAVRVRRTSDNAEQNFTFTEITDGTLATWVGVGNNGFMTTWYDQVGTNHMTQTIALRQPQIVENGVVYLSNGLPILRRTRNDVGMYSTYTPNGTNRQIFTVIESQYLNVKKNILLGSKTSNQDFAYTGEDASISTVIHQNVIIANEKRNGATFTYIDRNDVYNTLSNKSLLSFNIDFNFTDNTLAFGYNPISSMLNFSMYDMQEFILFENPQTVPPIETNINNYYSVF